MVRLIAQKSSMRTYIGPWRIEGAVPSISIRLSPLVHSIMTTTESARALSRHTSSSSPSTARAARCAVVGRPCGVTPHARPSVDGRHPTMSVAAPSVAAAESARLARPGLASKRPTLPSISSSHLTAAKPKAQPTHIAAIGGMINSDRLPPPAQADSSNQPASRTTTQAAISMATAKESCDDAEASSVHGSSESSSEQYGSGISLRMCVANVSYHSLLSTNRSTPSKNSETAGAPSSLRARLFLRGGLTTAEPLRDFSGMLMSGSVSMAEGSLAAGAERAGCQCSRRVANELARAKIRVQRVSKSRARWSAASRRALVVPGPGGGGAWTAGSCGTSPALPVSFELPDATR